jgi:hypothetical protein
MVRLNCPQRAAPRRLPMMRGANSTFYVYSSVKGATVKPMRHIPLILSAIFAFHGLQAQTNQSLQPVPSISVGMTTVALGGAVKTVTDALAFEYTVSVTSSRSPNTDRYLIVQRKDKMRIPIANLYARNGRVVGFEYTLDVSDTPSEGFNYFFALVDQLAKEHHNVCALTSGTSYLSGSFPLNKSFVNFDCHPYRFYLLKNEYNSENQLVAGYLLVEQIGETDY